MVRFPPSRRGDRWWPYGERWGVCGEMPSPAGSDNHGRSGARFCVRRDKAALYGPSRNALSLAIFEAVISIVRGFCSYHQVEIFQARQPVKVYDRVTTLGLFRKMTISTYISCLHGAEGGRRSFLFLKLQWSASLSGAAAKRIPAGKRGVQVLK